VKGEELRAEHLGVTASPLTWQEHPQEWWGTVLGCNSTGTSSPARQLLSRKLEAQPSQAPIEQVVPHLEVKQSSWGEASAWVAGPCFHFVLLSSPHATAYLALCMVLFYIKKILSTVQGC
jgi:hypothetical protein